MFHRFSTWWRAHVVVLISLATVPWPSAAQAATTPSVDILHQDAVAVGQTTLYDEQGAIGYSAVCAVADTRTVAT